MVCGAPEPTGWIPATATRPIGPTLSATYPKPAIDRTRQNTSPRATPSKTLLRRRCGDLLGGKLAGCGPGLSVPTDRSPPVADPLAGPDGEGTAGISEVGSSGRSGDRPSIP